MEINYYSGVIFITAGIFCLVSEVRTGTIPLISVRRGEPQVIVPCHSLDGIPPPLVQSVEWTKGTPNTNDDVRENIVVYYFPSNVTSDRGGGTYELSHGHGLVIRTPTSMDSARYTCNVTDTSGVALASIVDLSVTDDDPTDNSGPIHHYIVPVIIVFLVVAESAFIVAMWLNLRKASVTSAHGCPERLDSDLQEHRVEASDGHRGEAVIPPWKTPAGKKQALLLDDLNDGVLLGRRDSGYEERLSIESVSGKHGGELV